MKVFYKAISVVFHPIFIPLLTSIYFLSLIKGFLLKNQYEYILVLMALGTSVLPMLVAAFLYFFNMIRSLEIKEKQERYLPIIASGILIYFTAKQISEITIASYLSSYLLGLVISLSWIFVFLKRIKISLHSSAIAASLGFVIYISIKLGVNAVLPAVIIVSILGLVSTSRLYLKDHTHSEIYWGIVIGILPQLISLILD